MSASTVELIFRPTPDDAVERRGPHKVPVPTGSGSARPSTVANSAACSIHKLDLLRGRHGLDLALRVRGGSKNVESVVLG